MAPFFVIFALHPSLDSTALETPLCADIFAPREANG